MGVWGGVGVAESTPRSSFEPLQSEHRVQYGPDNADTTQGLAVYNWCMQKSE